MKVAGKGTSTAERGGLCEEELQEDDNSWEEGTADWELWSNKSNVCEHLVMRYPVGVTTILSSNHTSKLTDVSCGAITQHCISHFHLHWCSINISHIPTLV